jgi:glycosyltransferase involved in cell wall biosynthesis
VIIPAFNEEGALPATLVELSAEVPELDVVVVSDGSTDRTAAVARAAGVPVLELPFNLGIGGALRAGFRYAVARGYDAAVQVDGDGQHDPGQIHKLLTALDGGADMVIGSRFAKESARYEVGGTRRSAMRLLQIAVRLLSGHRFSDTSSGFRAFNRAVLSFFAREYPSEYMESVESLVLATYEGFDVVEVPVDMRPRAAGVASARRLRLAYHYLRLLVVLGASASRRRVQPPAAPPPVTT